MKSKSVIVTMIMLVLLSSLAFTHYAPHVVAEDTVAEASDEVILETAETANMNSTSKFGESGQEIGDSSKQDIDGKDYAQDRTSEGFVQTSRGDVNEWNFSDISRWRDFAYVDGNVTRLVVGVNSEKPSSYVELQKIVARYQAEIVNTISIEGEIRAVVVELMLVSMTAFVEEVHALGLARYIEPNMKVHIQLLPNDPYWSYQWGPQKIEADWAWNSTLGDPSVLVAVVDTGIDYTHLDLSANYVSLGYDWAYNDTDPMDDHGHGTHVSGTIAAVINNSIGVAGLAQVRIMAEKVLDSGGWGTWDSIASGIIHAVDQDADIISMSLGGYGHSELAYEAVRYAYDSGVLVIAAAGNENTDMKLYPAGYDEVVAVVATDQWDNKAWFSNWGDWVELAAPGVDIYSTVPWGYTYASGTSMATPHVSGLAALVWSRFPNKTRDWVRLWLQYTADDLGDIGFDVFYGFGRINARKAVEQSPPEHELVASKWKTPPYVEPAGLATINASVLNFGENNETDVVMQLLANGTVVDSGSIGFLASGETATVGLTWNPMVEGLYNVTLYVVPVVGELSVDNNVLWKYIYVGVPVKAVVLHSAGNVISEIITNWQVLNSEWYRFGDTMIYIDFSTLNIEDISYEDIATTEADVLIISCAFDPGMGWQFTDSEIEAIKRYVSEGHGLIVTAGTLYYRVANNNKLAPLVGLNETIMWDATGTDLVHLVNITHPLFRNVPNPFVFAYVGTAISSDWRWDSNELAGGEYMALGQFKESAIVTHRGLVYISPWLEIIPAYYQHHLQLLYNAITWSRYQRPEHELVTSLESPTRLTPGEATVLNATISNFGTNNETDVELQLLIDDVMVKTVIIPELQVGSSYMMNYSWTPAVEGSYNVTAYAPPVPGEEFIENNVARRTVTVLLIAVRNVLVYTDDYAVSPVSRYPIVALNNLGINYTHYIDDPWGFGAALVSQPWDLVIVDHANWYALGDYWTEVEDYVHGGGLLVLSSFDIDGSHSEPTTLWDILGVQWVSDMSYPEPVYRWIPTHPIFTFPNNVGDLTSFMEGYRDDGDHVTATTGTAVAGFTKSPTEDYAGVVLGNAYKTVLFSFLLCEFRFDEDVDGKLDAVELWENAIVYVAKPVKHDVAALLDAPTFLEPDDSVLVNATVHNRGSSNETGVELQLLINDTLVDSVVIPVLLNGTSYTLGYLWTPTVEGIYNVTAYAPPLVNETLTANNVATKLVRVRPIKGYILFDQVHGTDRMELYSTWISNLTEQGYVIEPLFSEPVTFPILERFDVFVVPQAHYAYTPVELSAVQNFVLNGGGLLVIGDDNPQIYTNLTSFAGITWTGGGAGGYTNDITLHPVTEGVNTAYFAVPISQIHVVSPAVDLIRDQQGYVMLAVSEVGVGRVLGIADEQSIDNYDIGEADNLKLACNMIDWLAIRYEHDLVVTLEAPRMLELESLSTLNATVGNAGLSNETGVELYLLINATVVGNVTIPELLVGESFTFSFSWTPSRIGRYNVSVYAPPLPEEGYIRNNNVTMEVYVFSYTRLHLPGRWVGGGSPMGWHADDASWPYTLPFDFPFYGIYYRTIYISSNGLITFLSPDTSYFSNISELARRMAIAPAWDDWVTYSPHDIYIWQNSTSMGIRWYVRRLGTNLTSNFEAILRSNGTIHLNYAYSDGYVSATIGIANGVGHVLAEEVTDLYYIETRAFVPFRLEHDVAVLDVTPSVYEAEVGEAVDVTVVAENQGNFTESFPVSLFASSLNSTRIYFDPSNYSFDPSYVSVGYRFNASVWVEDVADLYAWQVRIDFNDTIINVTRWFEPTWDPLYVFYGKTTLPLPTPPEVAYVHRGPGQGSAMVGVSLFGDQPTFYGKGLLFIVEFEVTAVPLAGETLSSSLDIDNEQTFLLDSYIDFILNVHKENGYYAVGPGAPPPPRRVYRIGTMAVVDLAPGARTTLVFTWDTTGVLAGDYLIWAEAGRVQGENDTADNTYFDGVIKMIKAPSASFTYSPAFPKPGETVTFNASSSNPDGGAIVSYNWNFGDGNITASAAPIITHTYTFSGSYNVSLTIVDSEGLADSTWKTLYIYTRDIAIIEVMASTDRTYIGRIVQVNVTVLNEGEVIETFGVVLYYNITAGDIIGTQIVTDLIPGEYRTLTFLWNTTNVEPCHNYTITAYAVPVLGETDIADNVVSSPAPVKVKLVGDINGDGKVDIEDIAIVALAFGSHPSHPRWNLEADLNQDGVIDIKDIAIVAKNFGKTYP